jgi:UDP-N-acetylmuramate: L-alanyl-gamma-D-glutamyl-meso-diaminopimelate ligase
MVQLSDAPLIVLEGDEYFSSPLDMRSKFVHYHPHIAVLTGIAWDHINVFPNFEDYRKAFEAFIPTVSDTLIYAKNDPVLGTIIHETPAETIGYTFMPHEIDPQGNSFLKDKKGNLYPIHVFGKHNLMNMRAAYFVCRAIGVSDHDFLVAMQSFKGAAKRLELLIQNEDSAIYKDFAHAPSKVKASTEALKEQFPERRLIACLELHTFSSLNKTFLKTYRGTLAAADTAIVYYSEHTLSMKKLPLLTEEDIREAFGYERLFICKEEKELENYLLAQNPYRTTILMMSSGKFGNLNWELLKTIIS